MSKLSNIKGRINYISSKARQENLYAVYETTERKFWGELAKCNQEEVKKSGTDGKCIEAKKLIIALPESFTEYQSDMLLKLFTEHFKQNYGMECIAAALHHNKRKTNYHIHLIFSERQLLAEPEEKVTTRNMFYDENGKHRRTKKEILDEEDNLREGCKIIPKGTVYERNTFTIKDSRFKQESFLDEVKKSYTDLINLYVKNEKEKLTAFDKSGSYLLTKKIGKNNPKAVQVALNNEQREKWNQTVDRAILCGVPEQKNNPKPKRRTEGQDKEENQMKKYIVEENGLSYTLGADGLYYPDLILSEDTNYPIGRCGRMRKEYLQEHRKVYYTKLILEGKLNQHLHQIKEDCHQRIDMIME